MFSVRRLDVRALLQQVFLDIDAVRIDLAQKQRSDCIAGRCRAAVFCSIGE
jgi:hypothetical protein